MRRTVLEEGTGPGRGEVLWLLERGQEVIWMIWKSWGKVEKGKVCDGIWKGSFKRHREKCPGKISLKYTFPRNFGKEPSWRRHLLLSLRYRSNVGGGGGIHFGRCISCGKLWHRKCSRPFEGLYDRDRFLQDHFIRSTIFFTSVSSRCLPRHRRWPTDFPDPALPAILRAVLSEVIDIFFI